LGPGISSGFTISSKIFLTKVTSGFSTSFPSCACFQMSVRSDFIFDVSYLTTSCPFIITPSKPFDFIKSAGFLYFSLNFLIFFSPLLFNYQSVNPPELLITKGFLGNASCGDNSIISSNLKLLKIFFSFL